MGNPGQKKVGLISIIKKISHTSLRDKMLRTFPWRSARFFATGLASYQTISAAELLASASGPALCIFFSLVGLYCGARWGFWGVECSFCSPPTSFSSRESTRSIRNRSSSYSLHLFRRRAPSDLRVCDFLFALSFVRFRPTGARAVSYTHLTLPTILRV